MSDDLTLYRLEVGEYDFDYDQLRAIAVWASDEDDARFIAAAAAEDASGTAWAGGEGPMPTELADVLAALRADPSKASAPWWLDPTRSTCTEVAHVRGVVQGYMRHG